MAWYLRNAADDTMYEPETLYARFGHWLAAVGDDTVINTYATGVVVLLAALIRGESRSE